MLLYEIIILIGALKVKTPNAQAQRLTPKLVTEMSVPRINRSGYKVYLRILSITSLRDARASETCKRTEMSKWTSTWDEQSKKRQPFTKDWVQIYQVNRV
jgi:hypothetical protein